MLPVSSIQVLASSVEERMHVDEARAVYTRTCDHVTRTATNCIDQSNPSHTDWNGDLDMRVLDLQFPRFIY